MEVEVEEPWWFENKSRSSHGDVVSESVRVTLGVTVRERLEAKGSSSCDFHAERKSRSET